jgi:AcrR family transcriptional regulator
MALTARSTRRAVILRESARLFAARGFHGVSVDDLGSAVGITGPGIYRHFTGKEALLGEILVSISEQLLDGGRSRADDPDPRAALESLVDFHVEFALTEPELTTVQDRDFHSLGEADARRVRRLQREYVELWVDALRAVRPGLDEDTARAATHATFGLLNSTPHVPGRTTLARPQLAALLRRTALAALLAA